MKNRTWYQITDVDDPMCLWRKTPDGICECTSKVDGFTPCDGDAEIATDGYRNITKREARSLFPNAFPKKAKAQ